MNVRNELCFISSMTNLLFSSGKIPTPSSAYVKMLNSEFDGDFFENVGFVATKEPQKSKVKKICASLWKHK